MKVARQSWEFFGYLDITQTSFEDIKQRLKEKELDWKYIMWDDEGREIIVFGSTALRVEK